MSGLGQNGDCTTASLSLRVPPPVPIPVSSPGASLRYAPAKRCARACSALLTLLSTGAYPLMSLTARAGPPYMLDMPRLASPGGLSLAALQVPSLRARSLPCSLAAAVSRLAVWPLIHLRRA